MIIHNTFAAHYEIPKNLNFDFKENIKNTEIFFLLLRLNNPEINYVIAEIEKETFSLCRPFENIECLVYDCYPDMPNLILKMFYWDETERGNDYWSDIHSDFECRDLKLNNKYKWECAVNKSKPKNREIIKITI